MKKTCIMILISCAMLSAHSQNSNFVWAVHMGGFGVDTGRTINTDANGNVYTSGKYEGKVDFDPGPDTFYLSNPSESYFIQKLDSNGNFLWARSLRGSNTDHVAHINADDAGNVYSTGVFTGSVDFDPGPDDLSLISFGGFDAFVQKLDPDGNFLWAKQIGSTGGDRGNAITSDMDQNIYATGCMNGEIFIQKMDADGNLLWKKQIGGTEGGCGKTVITDIIGNVYITGDFRQTVDFDPGPGEHILTVPEFYTATFILKLDPDGNFLWAKNMGGIFIGDMAIDAGGNICSIGTFWDELDFDPSEEVYNLTPVGGPEMFVQKLDADGNFIWAKQIGGTEQEYGYAIATDDFENIYLTGNFFGTVDFDPSESTYNLSSFGNSDIFIQKIDSAGDLVWVKIIGGLLFDRGSGITIDDNNYVYTTGLYSGNVDFDPSNGTYELGFAGKHNAFIQKMETNTVKTEDYFSPIPYEIFPNPTDGKFTIAFESVMAKIKLTVTDEKGRLIQSSLADNTNNIYVEINNPPGIYFVEINVPNGRETIKLVKK